MGTSVQHEPPNPEIVPPGLPPEDGSSPTIQPIVPPVAPATEDRDRYLSMMESTIREQNRQIQELTTKLTSGPAAPVAPAKTAEEQRVDFYNDPMSNTRAIIREELNQTVAPLLEFVQSMKATTKVDQFVNQFKTDSRFAAQWDSAVEAAIRENAGAVPVAQLTEQVFGMMVLSAIGMKASGMLRGATAPIQPSAPAPVPRNDPPHMRPSAPAGPTGSQPPRQRRALSEEEKRIARENSMTEEQYLDWQEMPSTTVVQSTLGRIPVTPPAPPRVS